MSPICFHKICIPLPIVLFIGAFFFLLQDNQMIRRDLECSHSGLCYHSTVNGTWGFGVWLLITDTVTSSVTSLTFPQLENHTALFLSTYTDAAQTSLFSGDRQKPFWEMQEIATWSRSRWGSLREHGTTKKSKLQHFITPGTYWTSQIDDI